MLLLEAREVVHEDVVQGDGVERFVAEGRAVSARELVRGGVRSSVGMRCRRRISAEKEEREERDGVGEVHLAGVIGVERIEAGDLGAGPGPEEEAPEDADGIGQVVRAVAVGVTPSKRAVAWLEVAAPRPVLRPKLVERHRSVALDRLAEFVDVGEVFGRHRR